MQSPVVQTRKRTERQGKRINSTLLHKPRIKRGFLFCFCSVSHMSAPQITGNDRAASSRRHMCSVPLRPHFITHMSYPSARLRPAFCPRTPRLCGRDFTERPPQIRYPRAPKIRCSAAGAYFPRYSPLCRTVDLCGKMLYNG